MPGRFTSPDTQKTFVPCARGVPIFVYSSTGCEKIHGSDIIVSTLFTQVGDAHAPATAGKGGFKRG